MSSPDPRDREMRCDACGARIFTSRADELVSASYRCPRCLGGVSLAPDSSRVFVYPHVQPAGEAREA